MLSFFRIRNLAVIEAMVERLTDSARVKEIARMIGGAVLTGDIRPSAREEQSTPRVPTKVEGIIENPAWRKRKPAQERRH